MKKQPTAGLTSRQPRHLLAFLEAETRKLARRNKLTLVQNYKSSGRCFARYLASRGRHDVALSRLTPELLAGYQQWMVDGGLQRNTAAFYLRNLHAVYNRAVSQQLASDRKPFAGLATAITHTEKRAVGKAVIRRISTLDIAAGLRRLGHKPGSKNYLRLCRELAFARDTFIFCFCARGMAFVDFAYLRPENLRHGRLVYERRKTGQHIEVKVQPQMQKFIQQYATDNGRYLFPVLTCPEVARAHRQYATALRRYNKQLDRLARMLGPNASLTSYVARHSWATAAYHTNVPLAHISEAMGHRSEKTTRIYLKSLEESQIDKENKRLLDGIFKS